jgi:hypothetical protein
MYRGYANLIENCIVEEVPEDSTRHAGFPAWGRNNSWYGCIALKTKQGYIPATVTSDGDADHAYYENCLAIDNSVNGWAIQTVYGLRMRHCTAIGAASHGFSASTGRISYRDAGFKASIDMENMLCAFNNKYGFLVSDLSNFSSIRIDYCSGWNNTSGTWSSGTSGRTNTIANQNPAFAGTYVFIPADSPYKAAGKEGADVGANILYRYQDGSLTDQPLWDREKAAFPHGAIIEGVNDIAGRSLFDVHQRLGITPALLEEVYPPRSATKTDWSLY